MISIETQIAGLKQLKMHAPIVYKLKINELINEFVHLRNRQSSMSSFSKNSKRIEILKTLLTYS